MFKHGNKSSAIETWYKTSLDIPSCNHLALIAHSISPFGGKDEDLYSFVEYSSKGVFVAKYRVYSFYRHDRPSKSEHNVTKYDKDDNVLSFHYLS